MPDNVSMETQHAPAFNVGDTITYDDGTDTGRIVNIVDGWAHIRWSNGRSQVEVSRMGDKFRVVS